MTRHRTDFEPTPNGGLPTMLRTCARSLSHLLAYSLVSCLLLAALPGVAAAHEVVLIPTKIGGQTFLLPVVTRQADLSVSPASLSFGDLEAGQSAAEDLTLTNVGARALTVTFAPPVAELTVSPASVTLLPQGTAGDSATVTVTWAPVSSEPLIGALTLESSHPGVAAPASGAVEVSGTAGGAFLDLSEVFFGVVRPGVPTSRSVWLRNPSQLVAADVTLAVAGSSAIAVSPQQLTLAPGQTTQADVTWTPLADGTLAAALTATARFDGVAEPAIQAKPLTGYSRDFPALPPGFGFGTVGVGLSGEIAVTLTNPSAAPVTVEFPVGGDLSLAPNDQSLGQTDLFGLSHPAHITVAAGQTRLVEFVWSPSSLTPLDQAMDFRIWYPDTTWHGFFEPRLEVLPVSGTPLPGPDLELRMNGAVADSFDFGRVSRRPYVWTTAPGFDLELHNHGAVVARVLPEHQIFVGCNAAGLMNLCVLDENNDPPPFDVPAGGSLTLHWKFFVDDVGPIARTLVFDVEGGDPVEFEVSAVGVPYLIDFGGGAASQAGSPIQAGDPAQAGAPVRSGSAAVAAANKGDNIDPFANDPLATYRPTGFDSRGLFSVGEFDTVDLRSGNLVLTVPIVSQSVRAGLGYSLAATYNSNVWARRSVYDPSGGGEPLPGPPPPPWNAEFPDPIHNAGLGWSVHLGRLRPPLNLDGFADRETEVDTGPYWTYIDPSGALHNFSKSLNRAQNPHALQNGLLNVSPLFARDGSRLRLELVAGKRQVQFPDGGYHVFGLEPQTTPSQPDQWRLEEIHDRFGNVVAIRYPDDYTWVICDPFRITTVRFQPGQNPYYRAMVGSISTAAHPPGGNRTECSATPVGSPLIDRSWTFSWHIVAADRPPGDTYPPNHTPQTETVFVPVIDGITLPDGTSWTFGYQGDHRMDVAHLPTGGSVHWEYDDQIPDVSIADCFNDGRWSHPRSAGVERRYARDAGGGAILSDTRYLRRLQHSADLPDGACAQYTDPPPAGQDPNYVEVTPAPELQVGIWSQLESGRSSLDVSYFTIWPFPAYNGSALGWDTRERGLNQTRAFPPRGPNQDRYLTSRLFACNQNLSSTTVLTQLTQGGCTLEESRWVKYELPAADTCEAVGGAPCFVGERVVESETVYHTDGGRTASVVHKNYDGLGHYRRTETGGTFSSGNAVTHYQDFNPGGGTLVLNANGHVVGSDVTLPDPWILDTYRQKWVQEDGVRRGGEAIFDADTGWMRLERTWEHGGAGPHDLVVLSTHDAQGKLEERRFFGANTYSGAGLTAGDWHLANKEDNYWGVSRADYNVDYEYQYGVLSRQRVAGESVYDVWRTIDEVTGRVAEETLNNGEELTYSYDPMGRVTAIRSDVAANREFKYTKPANSPTGGWKLVARSYRKGEGSVAGPGIVAAPSALTRYEVHYDGLGRVSTEQIEHPSGVPSVQTTTYHPSGLVASRTMVNDSAKSRDVSYDFKGRVLAVNNPDGTSVTYVYKGVRERQTRAAVGSGGTAVTGVTKVEYDRQGRMARVERGRLAGGEVAQPPLNATAFTYDPQGRVTQATRGGQARTMTYDGRGFLLTEQIPERTTVVHYSNFNTRGQARTVQHKIGAQVRRSASHVYDRLGRPTSLTIDGDLIKSWTYHACNLNAAGGDLGNCPSRNGQVALALRHNFRTSDDTGGVVCNAQFPCARGRFAVEQDYGYDPAGRSASRMTHVSYARLNASGGVIDEENSGWFHQTWDYEDTGWVTETGYPAVCIDPDPEDPNVDPNPAQDCGPAKEVEYTYVRGFLTKVVEPGLGAQLSYHPDGSIHVVDHDGVALQTVDTYEADPSGLSRVGKITLAGGSLTLGPYVYDAAGNVLSIAGVFDTFSYDAASRLTGASILAGSHTYDYDYDPYDNLQWGTVSPTTNQWVGGGNAYDEFGNWTVAPGGIEMRYDGLDKITAMFDSAAAVGSCGGTAANCTLSLYDPDDLRILEVRHGQGPFTWTIRDLDGKVLSELRGSGAPLKERDYIYAGSRLIASHQVLDGVRTRRYHLDHLGTPRVVTGPGFPTEFSHYSPYGVEISSPTDETIAGFARHERDGEGLFASNSMRARQYLPLGGRFMQVDPGRDTAAWSLYAYSADNPVSALDPDGLAVWYISRELGGEEVRDVRNPYSHSYVAITDNEGTVVSTYSWGNNGYMGFWHANVPSDIETAQMAIDQGKARPSGDDSLDPYVERAYEDVKDDDPHPNGIVVCNCKWEASGLITEAQRKRAAAGEQRSAAEKRWLREQRREQAERRRAQAEEKRRMKDVRKKVGIPSLDEPPPE